jgi:probable selenium-dependent hydroxylase accessory protein YqeC
MLLIQRTNNPLDFVEGVKYASFTGGGGKTTLIERLAYSCISRNISVAIATTAKIFAVKPFLTFADWKTRGPDPSFARIGKTLEDGKLTGLSADEVRMLGAVYDVVLIEADGAKGCPLKFPAPHEPIIVPFSDKVFIVAGMDSLFRPFDDVVFRAPLFREHTGLDPRLVYPDIFVRFFSDDALLKGTVGMDRTIVINKYDAFPHRHMAAVLLKKIMEKTGISEGLITAAKYGMFYRLSAIG